MRSLRTKISLITLIITVIAVAVVTLTSVLFIRNTEHRKSDQLLLLLCETGEGISTTTSTALRSP